MPLNNARRLSPLSVETETALERATSSTLRHEGLFSARAAKIRQSAVRDVFDLSTRPGLISLAGGSPSLESLPLEQLGQSAQRIIASHGLEALQYGVGQGMETLRQLICEVMAEEGILDVDPADVVVTTGSQSAQDIATKIFCDPGDVVLCEDPTYVGALNTFEVYEVDVQPVTMDEDGLIPEQLSATIERLKNDGRTIKFLYTVPSFNNPSGITLAADRRQQVVDICRAHGILVVEDNPYGLLRFDGKPLAPLRAGNPDDVLYLGSFSKIFAPGVRLGWALVPRHLHRRFYLASEAVVLCPSPLTQMLVSAFLTDYDWRAHVRTMRTQYRDRCAAMVEALQDYLPDGVGWTRPEGGFFVWLTLPEGTDTYPLLHEAIEAGVVFIPGAAFTPSGKPSHQLRLAFSAVSPANIREGVRRLAPILQRRLPRAGHSPN